MTTTYSTGTISVGSSSTTVTGVGTAWLTSGIRAGDRLEAAGLSGRIASVDSATQLTLARGWPGATLSGVNYDIWLVFDDDRVLVAANALISKLTGGTLTSLGGLAGGANKMPYWTGAGVMAETAITAAGRGLIDDADVAAMRTTLELVKTTSTLDATAGRLLRVSDFGFASDAPPTPVNNNLDTTRVSGIYRYQSDTTGRPAGSAGVVLHISRLAGEGVNRHWQLAFTNAIYSGIAQRSMLADGSWTAWYNIWSGQTLIGTVSQSSGVPTGAVIERGSNGNGEYMRIADGTQICWTDKAASSSATVTWTYPAAFSAAPAVNGTAQASVLSAVCLDAAPGTTTVTFSARDKTDARRADTCRLTAVGRWF